jgi:glycosyltransferase involved in cell wall biosynthesis
MLLRLIKSLDTDAFEPVILSQYRDELCERAESNDVSVEIVSFRGILDTYNRGLLSVSPIDVMKTGFRIGHFNLEARRLLWNADVVWCKNLRALLTLAPYAHICKTPIIWNIGLGLESDGSVRYLNAFALRLADKVFIESRLQAKSIWTADQYRRHEDKLTVFHKGIDVERFSPETTNSENYSDLRIGTAASLTPRKGIEYFIDAAAEINTTIDSDVEFLIAGEPSNAEDKKYARSLREHIRLFGLEDRVRFLGWVEDMPKYLNSLDVFVLPSLNEGIPGAVREALAMKVPVVATDVGGTADAVIDGETGRLVPPKDRTAIADAVTTLLTSPEKRQRMGRNGRQHVVTKFSMQNYVDRYEKLLHRTINNKTYKPY